MQNWSTIHVMTYVLRFSSVSKLEKPPGVAALVQECSILKALEKDRMAQQPCY